VTLPPDEVPPWGTPDDNPNYGTPVDRTTHHGTTHHGTPDNRTPDYGTPEPKEPDLHSVNTMVVLQRRGRQANDDYDLITVDGVQLGSILKETSTAGLIFSPALSKTYRMLNPRGFLVATLEGPGSQGPARFVLTDVRAAQVGSIEEEIGYGVPGLLLIGADGVPLRLLLGRNYDDGTWRLTDSVNGEQEFCRVSLEYVGARGRTLRRFSVELSPALIGTHRLLMIMAIIFLDHVSGAKSFGRGRWWYD